MCWRFAATTWAPAAQWPSTHSSEAMARPLTDWSSTAARLPASTSVHVTNVGGPGADTTANGILVVDAISGATTSPGAFSLSNPELRAGAFDYGLFRGGVSGSPNDWFLRSTLVSPPIPPAPPPPLSDHRAGTRHLWGGAASGAAIGAQHPRHARRPGRRHLRAGWLRRCACAPPPDLRSTCRPRSRRGPDQEARACALPVILALGLGPLLRPNDPQPLSSLRRSQRQRRSGRLPGRHRSSARISDRRPGYERAGLYGAYGDVTPT